MKKIFKVDNNSIYYDIINRMISNGKYTGKVRLKDGSYTSFKYAFRRKENDIITHYIQIGE